MDSISLQTGFDDLKRISFLAAVIALMACAPEARHPVDVATGPQAEGDVAAEKPVALPTPVVGDLQDLFAETKAPPRPLAGTQNPVVAKVDDGLRGDGEPDWTVRAKYLTDGFRERFRPPAVGDRISLKLSSGNERTGRIFSLDDEKVELETASGRMTIPRNVLSRKSRMQLFEDDFANVRAAKRLQVERDRYAAIKANRATEAEIVRQTRESRESLQGREVLMSSGSLPGSSERNGEGSPPKNAADGSVFQVVQYMKEQTRDPGSIRYTHWGAVHPHGSGYAVEVEYTTANSKETSLFLMRKNGEVFRKIAMRGTGI